MASSSVLMLLTRLLINEMRDTTCPFSSMKLNAALNVSVKFLRLSLIELRLAEKVSNALCVRIVLLIVSFSYVNCVTIPVISPDS